jgi:hypothetical protein
MRQTGVGRAPSDAFAVARLTRELSRVRLAQAALGAGPWGWRKRTQSLAVGARRKRAWELAVGGLAQADLGKLGVGARRKPARELAVGGWRKRTLRVAAKRCGSGAGLEARASLPALRPAARSR